MAELAEAFECLKQEELRTNVMSTFVDLNQARPKCFTCHFLSQNSGKMSAEWNDNLGLALQRPAIKVALEACMALAVWEET